MSDVNKNESENNENENNNEQENSGEVPLIEQKKRIGKE